MMSLENIQSNSLGVILILVFSLKLDLTVA